MNDFIEGFKLALRKCKSEPERYAEFNEEGWDIHARKGREMPANLKELEKLLWKAFRAGQQCTGSSILGSIESLYSIFDEDN